MKMFRWLENKGNEKLSFLRTELLIFCTLSGCNLFLRQKFTWNFFP